MQDGQPYIDAKFYGLVEEKMAVRSSLSVIHYFPAPPPKEGENGVFISADESVEAGNSVPSAVHQGISFFFHRKN